MLTVHYAEDCLIDDFKIHPLRLDLMLKDRFYAFNFTVFKVYCHVNFDVTICRSNRHLFWITVKKRYTIHYTSMSILLQ